MIWLMLFQYQIPLCLNRRRHDLRYLSKEDFKDELSSVENKRKNCRRDDENSAAEYGLK